jgi:fucose permease
VGSSPPELGVRPLRRAFQAAGLLTFFALGMPDGLLGVAWPEMRRAHHQPASALSVLLVCGTAAFFVSTSLSAPAAHRFGSRVLLIGGSLCAALGGVAIAASPTFAAVAVGVALLSGGAGLVDALVSSLVSLAGAARLIGIMHSIYAVGAAGAPLAIAAWTSSSSWRFVYLGIAGTHAVLLIAWCLFASDERLPRRTRARRDDEGSGMPLDVLAVAVALATFIAVSGLEIAAGAWAAVYVSDGLDRSAGTASLAALSFWAALCVARIVAGSGGIARARAWMIGGSVASVAGGFALWASPAVGVVIAAFALLGAGVGPLLPMLTVLTPHRVGQQAAAQVIGWQLAAASVGSALVAGGIGVWVHRSGLGAVPPALALMAVVMLGLVVWLDRQTGARAATAMYQAAPESRPAA